MSIEAIEVDFQTFVSFEEKTPTIWNRWEVKAIDDFERFKLAEAKIPSFDIQKGRLLTQTVTKFTLSAKERSL